jgi:hypothetical protein
MSKASGFVLLVAGLAAAAYVVVPWASDMSEPDLLPSFSNAAKLLPASGASEVAVVAPEPQPNAQPVPPPIAAAPERPPVPSFSAPVVITLAQRPNESAAPMPQKAGTLPRDRDAIGRELQKELKRVGCYEGELNGAWTPSTRQAMKAFTDRVNATLPTDEPDSILLTLVQAYQDRVCGKPCPVGQGLSETGRCMPSAILARAAKKGATPVTTAAAPAEKLTPAITAWSTTTTAATPAPIPPPAVAPAGAPPPTDGRMALAGPATPEATPPAGTPTPPAATPPAAPKRTPKVSEGNWARNVFRHQQSLN